MRTTITLDDDVAAKLKAEAGRTGKGFKATVNELLRQALNRKREAGTREPFLVEARDLGELQPGLSMDSIAGLLERVEGPNHR